jgi:chromosome segregation and condensation protein ScpB
MLGEKHLIECVGRLEVPGRPMLYATTSDFLRSFGLETLDQLPQTELPEPLAGPSNASAPAQDVSSAEVTE